MSAPNKTESPKRVVDTTAFRVALVGLVGAGLTALFANIDKVYQSPRSIAETEKIRAETQRIQVEVDNERSKNTAAGRRLAVADLQRHFRQSMMYPETHVLVLKNTAAATADFKLRCFTKTGTSKSFNVALAVGDSKEFGFLEGWDKNFLPGEYCTGEFEGAEIWRVEAPPPKK